MSKFLCAVTLSVVYLAVCQAVSQCDFKGLVVCMKPEAPNALVQQHAEDAKAKFEQCFIGNGCHLPPKHKKPTAEQRAAMECKKKIHQEVHADIEKCVQGKFQDFHFSSFNATHQHFAGRHHGFNQQKTKGGEHKGKSLQQNHFDHFFNQSCPNAEATENVKKCLKALAPHKDGAVHVENKFNVTKMCDKRNKCLGSLSAQCVQEMKDVRAELCRCGKVELETKGKNLLTQLNACSPKKTSVDVVHHAVKQSDQHSKEHAKGKFHGGPASGFHGFVQMMCQEHQDPCQKRQ